MASASSFLGMLLSMSTVVLGIIILGGNVGDFVDPASVMLTIVPTVGALIAAFPMSLLKQVGSHMKVLMKPAYRPEEFIADIYNMAKTARSEGLLSLEATLSDKDPFVEYAMRLVVDGSDEATVKGALSGYLDGIEIRHNEAINIYEKGAAFAPAFGMCATVISLVNMLNGLDFTDPTAISKLGGNMAAALITTFYGSIIANVLFIPVATRLKLLHKREIFCKVIISNGVLGIQRGDNPSNLRMILSEQLSAEGKQLVMGAEGESANPVNMKVG